ncbi:cation diffusion facilitator family transporter [Nocardioides marmoribigeumensis]|uniref:Cation diffusion facilitator family transporter n=1 Tax=Nocardioides marmoribigeumensis TaxID=433649 RepID=A0ABU2BZ59_9ACTN|nr:cation transporter [Nocardioides marmoribigeumensis]MDR7363700.1 cation diffusion facilitator family transporter [Nocardioides marmoribigeumensis]
MPERLADQGAENLAGGGESTRTVIIAFFANLAIALAKSVVAAISGSASMLAEAAHSWADTGNQVLLFIADRRGRKDPDATHPFGYGREAYVWSMFAALGLFTVGAAVSVWHGIDQLIAGGGEGEYTWAYVVLGVSFLFEGASFLQAFRQTRSEADHLDREVLDHALRTSDPTLRAVFAEDSAALVGLVIAAVGVGLHQLTGQAAWDAIGSILVGLLLAVVALVLVRRNLRFLTGEESDQRLRQAAISTVKSMDSVERVTYLRMEYVGPRKVLLVAAVDIHGDQAEPDVARQLRAVEAELEKDPNIVDAVLTLSTPDEQSL